MLTLPPNALWRVLAAFGASRRATITDLASDATYSYVFVASCIVGVVFLQPSLSFLLILLCFLSLFFFLLSNREVRNRRALPFMCYFYTPIQLQWREVLLSKYAGALSQLSSIRKCLFVVVKHCLEVLLAGGFFSDLLVLFVLFYFTVFCVLALHILYILFLFWSNYVFWFFSFFACVPIIAYVCKYFFYLYMYLCFLCMHLHWQKAAVQVLVICINFYLFSFLFDSLPFLYLA